MRTVKEDRIERLKRRAARAGDRAQARGEAPVGYESANTYSNPRMTVSYKHLTLPTKA